VTGGKDALGEVRVSVEFEGHEYAGRGLSQDVVEAAARAYVRAVNVYTAGMVGATRVSTVAPEGTDRRVQSPATLLDYERLEGAVPVAYAPGLANRAEELRYLLEVGVEALSEVLDVEPPGLEVLLVANRDWERAPRENSRAYPPGLPYFTRSVRPPALVLPETLSPTIRPRTRVTHPLVVWHELAHALLLQKEVVRTPAWLREFVPQAASAASARRAALPLEGHLAQVDREPGFTLRSLKGPVNVERQMAFQNLLLALGAAALEEFGEGFLQRLVHAVWDETDVVDEERADELLANALGAGGRAWLRARPEF
jgi:hypothetical protein